MVRSVAKPASPAKTAAKPKPKGTAKMGRPSSYRPEFVEQARKLAKLGAKDTEAADFFGVSLGTLCNWKRARPDFLSALKEGKADLDANVQNSLYHRAMGYSHEAVKIFADPKSGATTVVPYTEHFPPDTTACIFWLKNRQPDRWRDKHDVNHTGQIVHRISQMSPEERQQRAIQLSEKATLLLPEE